MLLTVDRAYGARVDEMDKAIRANQRAGKLLTASLWLMLAPLAIGAVLAVVVLVWLL